MRGQIERLIDASALPHVTAQILPFTAGQHPATYRQALDRICAQAKPAGQTEKTLRDIRKEY